MFEHQHWSSGWHWYSQLSRATKVEPLWAEVFNQCYSAIMELTWPRRWSWYGYSCYFSWCWACALSPSCLVLRPRFRFSVSPCCGGLSIRTVLEGAAHLANNLWFVCGSSIELPNIAAGIYNAELANRIRNFLMACPPSSPLPPVTELMLATADFQQDLVSWGIRYIYCASGVLCILIWWASLGSIPLEALVIVLHL